MGQEMGEDVGDIEQAMEEEMAGGGEDGHHFGWFYRKSTIHKAGES
jgi:hypothetical protein